MNNKTLTNSLLLLLPLILLLSAFQSSSKFEGDVLTYFLGKDAKSDELKELKANYNCEMANETHYLSRGGIELILKGGMLTEIHLYNGSAVYGNFTGKLPNGLKFGMYSSDVKRLLGKPVVSYNNGYSEYELDKYLLSCWFDSGKLNQIGIALK